MSVKLDYIKNLSFPIKAPEKGAYSSKAPFFIVEAEEATTW
jgi:hypothetical protein